jgi:hypothetical protein
VPCRRNKRRDLGSPGIMIMGITHHHGLSVDIDDLRREVGGLIQIVDLGFGPIVICPACGVVLNSVLSVVLIAVSAAAFFTNRATAGR